MASAIAASGVVPRMARGMWRRATAYAAAVVAASLMSAPAAISDDLGPPIRFVAEMSADEQSAYTESPGIGRAEFVLERATLRLTWTVTFSKLTSAPIGIAIHGPQAPGGNAGVLVEMSPNGVQNPLKGSAVLTDGQLEYLLTGRMYVNLRTQKYQAGELRGQIMRQPPKKD
ncbi:CHRD domain-containing protein [Povalibacter sp.]|uniref:CHRD domain-containing protein n=1 Tax=Povalibacter sp. TaxID=1962978 RepID=UPI002F3EE557